MSREVPFDMDAFCDNCGDAGAYDFMGDLLCLDCAEGKELTNEQVDSFLLDEGD